MVEYSERAVAFIDLLGFTAMVCATESDDANIAKLSSVVSLLSSVIPALDSIVGQDVPSNVIPTHTYISDCIILSAELDPNYRHADGLSSVVMRSIQITQKLLAAGYLVRGGISIGKVWHSNGNIVGPAYIEALNIERSTGKPRIALSERAAARWNSSQFNRLSKMCVDYDDSVMVNGLHDFYIDNREIHGSLESTWLKYQDIIGSNISNNAGNVKCCEKWIWFKDYFRQQTQNSAHWLAADVRNVSTGAHS